MSPISKPQVRVIATGLAVATFALHLWLARTFESLGVFEARDVLFDADISVRLLALSDWMPMGIKHPNLMFYFSPLVAMVAKLLQWVGFADMPEPEMRRTVGIFIVPLASALQSIVVLQIFLRLEVGLWRAMFLSTLMLASFSSLIFGSIPESYGLTALCMALAFLLAIVREPSWPRVRYYCAWILLCIFATGITISNIAFVGVILWAREMQDSSSWLRATAKAIGITALAFGITGMSALILDRLMPAPQAQAGIEKIEFETVVEAEAAESDSVAHRLAGEIVREFQLYLDQNPSGRLAFFPTSLAHTFAPKQIEIAENVTGEFRLAFTLEGTPRLPRRSDPLGTTLLILMVSGACLAMRCESSWRVMTLGAAGVLAGSWLMSVWGREVFLYSQTWHLAAMMFLAILVKGEQHVQVKTSAIVLLSLAVAITNGVTIAKILAILRTDAPTVTSGVASILGAA
jgi:hypothetical protein